MTRVDFQFPPITWISAVILCLVCPLGLHADDWPQWRGPNRDGISAETGILKSWPAEGPKVLWRMPLGNGFSAVSVAHGRAYTMFSDGTDEFVLCVDANSGKELWRFKSDQNYVERQGGDGPRCTALG
jgi:hypothetical protein